MALKQIISSTGDISQPYLTMGVLFAMVSKPYKSGGCSGGGGLPVLDAFQSATGALQVDAEKRGADGVIHIGYQYRVSTQQVGCNATAPVFELYAWGTAIRLVQGGVAT